MGDFLGDLALPTETAACPKSPSFPVSTIGNLDPAEAQRPPAPDQVLARGVGLHPRRRSGEGPGTLIRAYDDAAGVTAAFNRNLLHRLNSEAGAAFDVDAFRHEARWNAELERIEMHLVSRTAQEVRSAAPIRFSNGESIHTENSHKYRRDFIARAAAEAGWAVDVFLTDERRLFGVAILRPV